MALTPLVHGETDIYHPSYQFVSAATDLLHESMLPLLLTSLGCLLAQTPNRQHSAIARAAYLSGIPGLLCLFDDAMQSTATEEREATALLWLVRWRTSGSATSALQSL